MKINPSAKFTKSLFTLNVEDEGYTETEGVPFKEVNNTVTVKSTKKKRERKGIPQKRFLDNEDLENEKESDYYKEEPERTLGEIK